MAVYRVERTRDYTVMSNCHLKDTTLSLKAKGLMSMFLSFPENWNYTTRGLATICKEGVEAIGSTIKELEKAGYIVRRTLRGANGRITDTEYIIFEKPRQTDLQAPEGERPEPPAAPELPASEPPVPDTSQPDMTPPDADSPCTGNPDAVDPDMENQAQLNKNQFKTQKSNTQRSSTQSFPPPAPSAPPVLPVEGWKEIYEKRAEIEEQIEYARLADPSNREQLNEFVELMLEVALARNPTIRIGRDAEYPTAFVQHRFEQLTPEHIGKVLEGIQENTTRVWNTKAYLLAALFNAPSSTGNHYTMQVNHDMNNGGYGRR